MKYQEACTLKGKIGATFNNGNVEFQTLVAPANFEERKKFIDYIFQNDEFKKQDAKLFSSEGEFIVMGYTYHDATKILTSTKIPEI